MMSALVLFSLIAIAAWIYIEIRFPKPVWLRILSGLVAMGLITSLIAISLWGYVDYVTGTQVYFLEAIQRDLQEKPVDEVKEYLRTQVPEIKAYRNNATQMHRLLVERELSQLPANQKQ